MCTSLTVLGRNGFVVGHMPLDIDGFTDWEPELLTNEKVESDELDGYKIWKEG